MKGVRRDLEWSSEVLPSGVSDLCHDYLNLENDIDKPAQRWRFSVKPGFTGSWQINGCSELGFEECVNPSMTFKDSNQSAV